MRFHSPKRSLSVFDACERFVVAKLAQCHCSSHLSLYRATIRVLRERRAMSTASCTPTASFTGSTGPGLGDKALLLSRKGLSPLFSIALQSGDVTSWRANNKLPFDPARAEPRSDRSFGLLSPLPTGQHARLGDRVCFLPTGSIFHPCAAAKKRACRGILSRGKAREQARARSWRTCSIRFKCPHDTPQATGRISFARRSPLRSPFKATRKGAVTLASMAT